MLSQLTPLVKVALASCIQAYVLDLQKPWKVFKLSRKVEGVTPRDRLWPGSVDGTERLLDRLVQVQTIR